jgi:hypothetical protein
VLKARTLSSARCSSSSNDSSNLHRWSLPQEGMDALVVPIGPNHIDTIACTSLLRGRCHPYPVSARHPGRKSPGQMTAQLVPGMPLRRLRRHFRGPRAFNSWVISRRGRSEQGFVFFPGGRVYSDRNCVGHAFKLAAYELPCLICGNSHEGHVRV